MKKLLFVAVLGALVACNDTKTDGSADTTNVDTTIVTPAPIDTTTTPMMDTTSTMMSDTSSTMKADSAK